MFIAWGSDWLHYAGDPTDGTAEPFDADHAPVIGWRPAQDGPAIIALTAPAGGAPPVDFWAVHRSPALASFDRQDAPEHWARRHQPLVVAG